MNNIFKISVPIFLILSIFLLFSCKKDKPTPPVLTTTSVTAITQTTGTSGGNITDDGGATVLSRGVCWSINNTPTIADYKTLDGAGAGSFVSAISGLSANTIYFVRAYANNNAGTGYGMAMSFTTQPATVPVLTTAIATAITQNTATSGGTITSDGAASITARGVCWSTIQNPTISDSKTTDGSGTGDFTSTLTGLIGNTTYHIRAYATNSAGTQYGNQISFKTSPLIPTLSTTTISSITQTTATSGGNVTNDGGATVTARGVCWSTSANPTTANNKTINGTGTGVFTSSITGLTATTTYYLRAYATNIAGTAYGNEITFTTINLPSLTTKATSAITGTTATSGGNVTNDGGATVTARGVCWSTSANPTTANSKTIDGNGTGVFTSSITGLTATTTYYLRAYATNIAGTAYGDEIVFTTTNVPITLFTTGISSIIQTTATSGGNITSDGGATVTARGVCWNTSANPTTTNSKTIDGNGTGVFTSSITGLTAATTYYLRAYATSSIGTSYGNELVFKTYTGTLTDIDGNVYYTVTIGTQIWMAENLKTTKYSNGNIIGTTTPATLDVYGETSPKYQWAYDGNESNVATYGRLYTWYAATDSRNVCPLDWHLPSDAEWTTLTDYLTNNGYGYEGSGNDIGKSMAATSGWWSNPTAGSVGNDQNSNNSSGFTAVGGSRRNNNGIFQLLGAYGYWWSSSAYLTGNGWQRFMLSSYSTVERGGASSIYGLSIRCVKD